MSKPVYRAKEEELQQIRALLQLTIHTEEDGTRDHYTLALAEELRSRLTKREVECMSSYYLAKRPLTEIGRMYHIHLSTASRHIQRGLDKIRRLMKLADKISPIVLRPALR